MCAPSCCADLLFRKVGLCRKLLVSTDRQTDRHTVIADLTSALRRVSCMLAANRSLFEQTVDRYSLLALEVLGFRSFLIEFSKQCYRIDTEI